MVGSGRSNFADGPTMNDHGAGDHAVHHDAASGFAAANLLSYVQQAQQPDAADSALPGWSLAADLGVGQYNDRTTTDTFRGRAITDNGNDDDGACDRLIG